MTHFRELTDRYTLEKILRSTRAGTILRGIDNRTGQAVVAKLITVTSPPLLVQKAPELEKLGTVLESLREPSLPAVTDSGFTTEGSAFLVMELLDGRTLDTLAGPPQRLLGLLAQALDGLEALARRGISHGNLTPDNLLVEGAPPSEQVKLLGLGGALFREPGVDDLEAFARVTCQVLGITIAPGEVPSAQMPFALSLELDNSEALRRILERCLRRDLAVRPSYQEIRDAFRLALGEPTAPASLIPFPGGIASTPPATIAALPFPTPLQVLPAVPPQAALPVEPASSEDSGELLSAVDDDILNALSALPAAPVESAAPTAAGRVVPFRGAAAAAAAPPPPSKPNPILRPGVLAAFAGFLVLAAVGAFWWLSRSAPPPEAVAEASAPPPPAPRRPATEALDEAQWAMADENWGAALAALDSLDGADEASLSPAGCRSLAATQQALGRIGADRLPEILARGLRRGDLGSLRFAAWVAETQDVQMTGPLQTDLARGQSILDLYAGIEDAAARQADAEVLERFSALEKDLPGASDPQGVRGQAAARLESEAAELARAGSYQEALVRLDTVLRSWPQREPARGRAASYAKASRSTADQEALLEVLQTALRRKKPHEGLEALQGVEPVPHLSERIEKLRTELQEQLAFNDRQPPQIALRDGFLLDYDRGQVVEISFRVTDDYLVRSVKLMARPEGGRMREFPMEKSALGYTAKLLPSFHNNGTVSFYVVATDASRHEGYFGTADAPKKLQRRQGFERLVN